MLQVSVGRNPPHHYPKRGPVIRSDDPKFAYDISKRPKRERLAASKDGGLRPTKERVKKLQEQFRQDGTAEGDLSGVPRLRGHC